MIKLDIRELKEELLALKNENREMAGKVLRTVVRLTAQYIVRSHLDAARHTPAYSGNLLSNWNLTLGGAEVGYKPLPSYRLRQPLVGEDLRYPDLVNFSDISYQELADKKYREMSEKAYGIVWNSKVTLANASPYQVDDYGGSVSGVSDLSGKPFRVNLRPANQQAVSLNDIQMFASQVIPAVIDAVIAGQTHITFKSLSERIQ